MAYEKEYIKYQGKLVEKESFIAGMECMLDGVRELVRINPRNEGIKHTLLNLYKLKDDVERL